MIKLTADQRAYDRSLRYLDYRYLADAQAGAIDSYDQKKMGKIQHLVRKGYISISRPQQGATRFITLTPKGHKQLQLVGYDRRNSSEFWDNYPHMLDMMGN
jgi:hypothetical protein